MIEVCKASAGSGKTHKLTKDYILMLFKSDRKSSYKHIVAMTFTNKATDEMKQRIIENLHSIAKCGDSGDIYQSIYSYLETTPQFRGAMTSEIDTYIRDMANRFLIDILNDYTLFNISTIDKFFQHVLRSFAKDIGYLSSYNVEIDLGALLTETIDVMMENLTSNEDLLNWMIEMSVESIEEGHGWNPVPKLISLGGELFKETLKIKERELGCGIADRETIKKYRWATYKVVKGFEDSLKQIGERGVQIIANSSLHITDFSGGSRTPLLALKKWREGEIKEPTKTLRSLLDKPAEKWGAAKLSSSTRNSIQQAYSGGLCDVVSDGVKLFDLSYSEYKSKKAILKNLYTLGVLDDIYKTFREYSKGQNLIHISEANSFLMKLIDGSDAPFVYEKIGVNIDHFLIDEFQDTSLLQWENIHPLLNESLSRNLDNLIVGDVKQSIYRWRNSDWNLLNHEITERFPSPKSEITELDVNWRSRKNIVEFNNDFFTFCGDIVQQRYNSLFGEDNSLIKGIYTGFQQHLPPKPYSDEGHVKVSFLPSKDEDGLSWKEATLKLLEDDIAMLRESGRKFSDMAIVVRTNEEGTMVAEHLLKKGYRIVSDESLLLTCSHAVNKIVAILTSIASPENSLSRFIYDEELPPYTENSLYNLCEEIIRGMNGEDKLELPFIEAFMDCVLDYSSRNGQDIKGFLKWWNEFVNKRAISVPEDGNAIRIITIHKSKGLGFKVVLAPFFDETLYQHIMEERGKILWCSNPDSDQVKLLPVASTSSLKGTYFEKEYKEEVLYCYIDKINVAYVEFTRSKEELFIYAKLPDFSEDGSYTISSIADALYKYCGENSEYELGSYINCGSPLSQTDEIDEGDIEHEGEYLSIPIGERLKLLLRGGDFFAQNSMRSRGLVMHDILSHISTEDDLESGVNLSLYSGDISPAERVEIIRELRDRLHSVSDRHWFDGYYTHRNEMEIILPMEIRRPDRVMTKGDKAIVLDYKFGSLKLPKYKKQLKGYMDALLKMGYRDVKGYLWYLEDNEIVEIV